MRLIFTLIILVFCTTLRSQGYESGYKRFLEQVNSQDYAGALQTGEMLVAQADREMRSPDTLYANLAYYMGYMYFSKQEYDKALQYGLRDVEARKKMPAGTSDPQYYNSLYMLVAYYGHLEKYDQAIPLMEEITGHAQKQYGAQDKYTLQVNYQLANLYQNGGYMYRAEAVHEWNYEIVQQHYTPSDSIYQAMVNAVYTFYYTTGNFRKAEPFYTGAMVQLEKQYGGKENADYLNSLKGLVQFYIAADMLNKAVLSYKEYLELLEKLLGGKAHEDYLATLKDYIQLCINAADHERADAAYAECLPLTEKIRKTRKDTVYITTMNEAGEFYINAGKYDKAESIYLEFLELVESYFGKNSADYATAMNNLAVTYEKQGKNAEAEKLYLQTLKIKEKVFKKESSYYALTLVNLGVLYDNMGKYREAEKVLEQAVQVYEKVYGGESDHYATALNSIAAVYSAGGKTDKAIVYMQKALETYKNRTGEFSQGYITSLGNLAGLYVDRGEYARAEAGFEQAIALSEKVLGAGHTDLGVTLFNLANLKTTMGKYSEAEQLLQRALSIQQKAVGEKHGRYANVLQSLAALYATTGRYSLAERTYKSCEVLFRKVYGDRHPDYAVLLHNMGYFYHEKGDYTKAGQCLDKAMVIHLDLFGEDHPGSIPLLSTSANISMATGDFKTAESNLLAAVKTAEKNYGQQHPDYAVSINNLATLYRALGNYGLAKTYYEKALELRKTIYGEQHPEYAVSLNNLGALYLSLATDVRDAEKMRENASLAITYFQKAARIDSLVLGADHPDIAGHLNNLAEAYRLTNEPVPAEKNYLRAIEIEKKHFGDSYPGTAVTYHNLALLYAGMQQLAKAEEYALKSVKLFEKNFGPRSYASAGVTSSLAYIYESQQKDEKALEQYALAGDIQENILLHNFSFLSETEKEKFMASVDLYRDMFSTFALRYGQKHPGVYAQVYDQVLRHKGILFRSTRLMRNRVMASGDTSLVNLYEKWNNLKKELARAYALPVEKRNTNTGKMEEQANTLEKQLVIRTGTAAGKEATWTDIRNQLSPGQAAVEFIDFVYNDEKKENIYCALVVKPGMNQPQMIRLFSASELEKMIGRTGANNYEYVTGIYGKRSEVNSAIYNLVWKPLEKELEGIKEVFYAPSGMLNKVSFAALTDANGVYLPDKYQLHAVTVTAAVTENKEEKLDAGKAEMVVFGGVKYDTDKTATGVWKYLPGTLQEAERINTLLAANKINSRIYTGNQASEASLKALARENAPTVLHVATHGFFYAGTDEVKAAVKEETMQVDFRGGSRGVRTFVENPNPLMRSGIALAGANDVWNEEDITGEDGVLTAYEASLLNLQQTQLTVLSACETGLGDIKGSEGVYGLQRALRMAGSRFVIMSLWQVPDKETEEFMVGFYSALLKSKSIRKAFGETQAAMRKKYDPYFWAAFVLLE